MRAEKGLIIREPWIDMILSGEKTWEMRSSNTTFRGWFGLIRQGTGTVAGVAELLSVSGPLTVSELRANIDRHRVPRTRSAPERFPVGIMLGGSEKFSGCGPRLAIITSVAP